LQTEGTPRPSSSPWTLSAANLDEARLAVIFQQVKSDVAAVWPDGQHPAAGSGQAAERLSANGQAGATQRFAQNRGAESQRRTFWQVHRAVTGAWLYVEWERLDDAAASLLFAVEPGGLPQPGRDDPYLNTYLTQDGATTKPYRCLDKSYGNHSSGYPWWIDGGVRLAAEPKLSLFGLMRTTPEIARWAAGRARATTTSVPGRWRRTTTARTFM